jgi:hypothetical protein
VPPDIESMSATPFVPESVVSYTPTAVHWFNDRHDTSLKDPADDDPVAVSAGCGASAAVTLPVELIVLIRGRSPVVVSSYPPAATQPSKVQDTPSMNEFWLVPVPALDGTGVVIALQFEPSKRSSSPTVCNAVFS